MFPCSVGCHMGKGKGGEGSLCMQGMRGLHFTAPLIILFMFIIIICFQPRDQVRNTAAVQCTCSSDPSGEGFAFNNFLYSVISPISKGQPHVYAPARGTRGVTVTAAATSFLKMVEGGKEQLTIWLCMIYTIGRYYIIPAT
jgi:hypothetical protein